MLQVIVTRVPVFPTQVRFLQVLLVHHYVALEKRANMLTEPGLC